ncbi:BnaAnng09520D [Brassica napus]|uniref:lysine--tRNA ligase n=1 Tax=Brassica napus TaxID=3708 RepID=A0A078IAJ9_BRANA|nr:BnaAnng09520D [Brassica napus]
MEGSADQTTQAISKLSMDSTTSSTADGAGAPSKNALKKELKMKQREEERRRKEEEKAKQAPKATSQKAVAADDEDMDPTQYFENRLKYLAAEKAKGENPYPHKFAVSMSIPEYIEKYGGLNNGDHVEDAQVSLAGRIMSKRSSSSKLFFYDLHGEDYKVQVMADASKSGLDEAEFSKLHANTKRGDIVGVTGFPGKTKRGELSIFPRSFILLSHCLHMMPRKAENVNAKIVYDCTEMESFNNVKQWLSEIDRYANDSVCKLLIGNKNDMVESKVVSTETGKALADELGIPFLETSAKDSINVEQAFLTIAGEIKKRMGSQPNANNTSGSGTVQMKGQPILQNNGGCCSSS